MSNWDNFALYYCKYSSIAPAGSLIDIPSGGVTFFDADGSNVNVKLNNGDGYIYFNGEIEQVQNSGSKITLSGSDLMINQVILDETTSKSSLKITASGGTVNGTELNGICDEIYNSKGSSLKSISAANVTLTGDINLDGWLGSVKLNAIDDGVSINSAGETENLPNNPISKFNIGSIGNDVSIDIHGTLMSLSARQCDASLIAADNIGSIKISKSGLNANVFSYFGNIKKVFANGDISGSIYARDEVGRIINRSGTFTGSARSNIGLSQFNYTDLEVDETTS